MSPDTDIIAATADDTSAVVSLWRACGLVVAYNPPEVDFVRAVEGAASTVLLARCGAALLGSVMVGDDGHRAWIYYLATDPAHQRSGVGQKLVAAAESWAVDRGARKLQLMIRPSNQTVKEFYLATGYSETPRLVMAKWLDKEMANQHIKDRN